MPTPTVSPRQTIWSCYTTIHRNTFLLSIDLLFLSSSSVFALIAAILLCSFVLSCNGTVVVSSSSSCHVRTWTTATLHDTNTPYSIGLYVVTWVYCSVSLAYALFKCTNHLLSVVKTALQILCVRIIDERSPDRRWLLAIRLWIVWFWYSVRYDEYVGLMERIVLQHRLRTSSTSHEKFLLHCR